MITVKPCTVSELEHAPNLGELCAEYAQESAIDGLGPHNVQVEAYRAMENAGMLHLIGAFEGDTLVGFLVLVVTSMPHFGSLAATVESFFVSSNARKGGTGLRLLRSAESLACSLGAPAMFTHAPVGSRLDTVLSHQGYSEASRVFFKNLNRIGETHGD